MAAFLRNGENKRIVADPAVNTAPGRHVGHGVAPADTDAPCISGLKAILSSAHPVVSVFQRNTSDTVFLCQFNGAIHADAGVGVAHAEVTVPLFKGTEALHQSGALFGMDITLVHVRDHPREAVDSVGVYAIDAVLHHDFRAFLSNCVICGMMCFQLFKKYLFHFFRLDPKAHV